MTFTIVTSIVRALARGTPRLAALLVVLASVTTSKLVLAQRADKKPDAGADTKEEMVPDSEPDAGAADDGGDVTIDLSGGGDLVETLDAGPQAAPKASEPPPKPDKFQFRGFARVTGGVAIAPSPGDAPGAAPQERVPLDRAFVEQHLYADMRYSRSNWFQAVVSASLQLSEVYQQNQATTGDPTSSLDYTKLEATAREAYLGFFLGRLDLRIGQQRIAWGNSDAYAPNDVLNARDMRSPFLFDPEMVVLPSPAVRADFDMDFATASLVLEPFLVTDKIDLYGTSWSLVQQEAPVAYKRLFGVLSQGLDRSSVQGLQQTLTGGGLSPDSAADASIGASLRTHVGSVDLSYYFLSGFDHAPAVYVDPAFQQKLTTLDAGQLNGAVLDAILNEARASSKAFGGPIVVSYRRRNHVGMDAQTTAGSFVLRADVGYDSAKTFYSADSLNSIVRPAAQEVVGIEYQTGSFDKLILVEGWAMQVLDPEIQYVPTLTPTTGPLLWFGDQNYGASGVIRWSFFENTIFELRSSVGVSPFWALVRPEFGYESTTFSLRAGLLGIGGDAGSFGHYFRRNSTAYVTTRFLF